MKKQANPHSPFNWKGKPSIFTTGCWKSAQDFSGTNTGRALGQVRLEPRPTYMVADSKYMKQPKIGTRNG